MEKHGWKILAIVFIILFVIENLYLAWGFILLAQDDQKIDACYYEVCSDYPEAWYEDNLCTCFNLDFNTGEYVAAKTELMY